MDISCSLAQSTTFLKHAELLTKRALLARNSIREKEKRLRYVRE